MFPTLQALNPLIRRDSNIPSLMTKLLVVQENQEYDRMTMTMTMTMRILTYPLIEV